MEVVQVQIGVILLFPQFPFSLAVGRYLLKAETLSGPDGSRESMVPPYKNKEGEKSRTPDGDKGEKARGQGRRQGHRIPQAKTQRPGN